MTDSFPATTTRQRAPSARAIATRLRILDAAERVFAQAGYDGASLRDIASAAGEPVSLIHHHGGGKEALFAQVIRRRALPLAEARLTELARLRATSHLTAETLLRAFFQPLLERSKQDQGWQDYARLVAHVSADARWRDLAAECFDPTAQEFIAALCPICCNRPAAELAQGFVLAVSCMLACITSGWRVTALGGTPCDPLPGLVAFAAAGLRAG